VLDQWDNSLFTSDFNLVANLPYNVATKIILRALADTKCRTILVMIQKEVALKFSAKKADKENSSLGILTSMIATSELLFDVKGECFDPPPKVTSAVIKIEKTKDYIDDSLFKDTQEFEKFKHFLKVAFSAPRKTLVKNLKSEYNGDQILSTLGELDYGPTIRPHQLSYHDYHLLFKKIK